MAVLRCPYTYYNFYLADYGILERNGYIFSLIDKTETCVSVNGDITWLNKAQHLIHRIRVHFIWKNAIRADYGVKRAGGAQGGLRFQCSEEKISVETTSLGSI